MSHSPLRGAVGPSPPTAALSGSFGGRPPPCRKALDLGVQLGRADCHRLPASCEAGARRRREGRYI
eukprot:1940651-Pyramimonas_sp.AAC.1